jgi:predicted acetyltransferase
MPWQVRPCASADELRAAAAPISHYFGRSAPNENQLSSLERLMPAERAHAAWEDGHAVGGAGAYPFELTVPGGRIAAAGVTIVGVLPTHRRRGILTAMMRAQLDACHDRGESVAYLWATEDMIYGRFGYGIASFAAEIELPRERSAYYARFEPVGAPRLVPFTQAAHLVAPVYEHVAAETPGMFSRTAAWWQTRVLVDPEWRRRGGGELQCAVLEAEGRPAAYALYRLQPAWDRGVQTGVIEAVEAMGDSAQATRAIWRYLLDIDWMARLRAWPLPLDHPLLLLLAEPRRLRFSLRDGLWVRLVDVEAALSARSYAAPGVVIIEFVDQFCPWNEGRWQVGEGGSKRTEREPELRCDVTALGSVYLGGFTWAQLAQALRVEELRPGAIARADALFRTARAPWCPEIF